MRFKKILKILGIVIGCFIVLIAGGLIWFKAYSTSPKRIAAFIKQHPDKAAVLIVKNDHIVFQQNPNAMKPLASLMKTVVLLEYANQVASGELGNQSEVLLSALQRYWVKDTDGGAHEKWLAQLKTDKQGMNGKVFLEDIVRGMMLFSSNACTEYLMDRLGLDNINKNLAGLNINNHEKVFYLVSYLYLIQEVGPGKLAKMNNDEIVESTKKIHEKVKAEQIKYDYNKVLSEEEEELFSLKFTRSCPGTYIDLFAKITSDSTLKQIMQPVIDSVYKPVRQKNSWARHIFIKGGSTMSVLTQAYMIEAKNGDQYRVAYFLNDLDLLDYFILQASANNFDLAVLGRKGKLSDLLPVSQ